MAKQTNADPAVALARRLKAYFTIGTFTLPDFDGWEDASEDEIAEAINEVLAALMQELKPKS
jgi:hypothetical protein